MVVLLKAGILRGMFMKLNKRLTALGIVLLILVWAGNITYYKKHVLTEPLFIKHYYDIKKGMSSFRLFYIQNINSKDSITSIVLPEISNQPVNFNEHL
jgi:hypothetical protein